MKFTVIDGIQRNSEHCSHQMKISPSMVFAGSLMSQIVANESSDSQHAIVYNRNRCKETALAWISCDKKIVFFWKITHSENHKYHQSIALTTSNVNLLWDNNTDAWD